VALWTWYRGDLFQGWQAQPTGRSVQDVLAAALRSRGGMARPMASGRTDRGVHARSQPVSVRLPREVELSGLRSIGGDDWGVALAVPAPAGFHAQWSATWKEYRYRLALGAVPADWAGLAWGVDQHPRLAGTRLDLSRLEAALVAAHGARDFAAFHARSSIRRTRTLMESAVTQAGDLVEVRLRGDAFGRYGVRLLVGGAVLVAAGRLQRSAWDAALGGEAGIEGLRAPAAGLTLWGVGYPPALDPFVGHLAEVPQHPPFVPIDQA
jgi:tRNA pseudouridine38-40 synthase